MDKKHQLVELQEGRSDLVVPVRSALEMSSYLKGSDSTAPAHLSLLTQIYSGEGIGLPIYGDDKILYYYAGLASHYVFSRGGRSILYLSKGLLQFSRAIEHIIRQRFMQINEVSDAVLCDHFINLKDLSIGKAGRAGIIESLLSAGRCVIHMRDLKTPFIEIATHEKQYLVVPLSWLVACVECDVMPERLIKYAGQFVLCCRNDEDTVRVMYNAHVLDDKLFQSRLI